MMSRELGNLSLCAVMIDGIHVDEHVVLVALGFDSDGNKHVLGLYEGATENSVCCKGLLSDLQCRGLDTGRAMLLVIDGSKSLAKAIFAKFGPRALIQRCQVHKRRIENVNGSIRKTTHNVHRWTSGEMILRWVAVALDQAAMTFRRVDGYRALPKLVAALQAHLSRLTPKPIDRSANAA